MNTPVVVRNSVTVLVPEGSVDSWRAICQLLGHSLYWDQESGVLHVDSVLHGLTVVIDPGHGGSDRAGRGAMGYVEADAVLDVALRLAPLLEGIGGRVILTRDRDATVTLEERVRMVRLARADFLLSLHSSPHLPPGQLQTLHTVLRWRRSRGLALSLTQWMKRKTGIEGQVRVAVWPWGDEPYAGLLYRGGAGAAVMLHLGGHGSPEGEAMLSDPSYLENCAQGIFWGTVGYLLDHPWPHREGFRLHHASQPQETVVSGPAVAGPPFTGLGPSVPLSPAPQTHAPPVSPPAVPAPPVSAPPVSAPGPGAAERAEQVERAGQAEWPEPPAPGSAQATTSSPRTVVTGGRVVVPGGSAGFSGSRVVTGRAVTPDKGTLGSGSHASGQVEVRKPFG